MRNLRHTICAAFLSAGLSASGPDALARKFEDQYGRTIEAELLAHWGAGNGYLKIEKGGKPYTVKTDMFSEKDQKEIADWMSANPELLVPLVDPPRSGEGLVGGTKWMLLSGGNRTEIDFAGAGMLKRNGVLDKLSRWAVNVNKDIAIRWGRGGQLVFSEAVVGKQIYRDPNFGALLIKIDRLAAGLKQDDLVGTTYVLAGARDLAAWAVPGKSRAIVDLLEEGKARLDGNPGTWKVAGGQLIVTSAGGRAAGFVAIARDVFLSRTGLVLWQVKPPKGK